MGRKKVNFGFEDFIIIIIFTVKWIRFVHLKVLFLYGQEFWASISV